MALKLEDHVFRVLENQKRLFDFLGQYDWDFDMNRGLLTFTQKRKGGLASFFGKGSKAQVIAECPVQILGTHSELDKSWLWAWANMESQIPAQLLRGVNQIKRDGETENIPQFTQLILPLPQDIAADMLAVICAGHLALFTYFACPYAGGAMFTAIEAFPPLDGSLRSALLVTQTIQAGISGFAFSHRNAVLAYLGEPISTDGDELVWKFGDESIRISFDELQRITSMQAELHRA